jgi:hypothetical protein
MNRRFHLVVYFVLSFVASFSQTAHSIKGQVINGASGAPIANCSVFINNTSKGTTTDTTGRFELSNIPDGKYVLIVSSIGYETYAHPFSGTQLPLELTVTLKEKATDLSAVTVEPFDPDGWEKWGEKFMDNFIGTKEFAHQCTIKNKEVIRLRYSSKKYLLTAVADQPIIIENKALGYTIKYQLEQFSVDFMSGRSVFMGYPLFTEMHAESKAMELLWEKNREKVYYGSLMHFIRSLYTGQLQSPNDFIGGFEVRRQVRRDNPDLTAGDLVTVNADQTKSLFFTGNLFVIYKRKLKIGTESQRSIISLVTPAPVKIEVNGYYDSPLELLIQEYWAWTEKFAYTLPLDYWPYAQ